MVLLASPAWGAVCTFGPGASTWGPIGTHTGTGVDCPAPDANDDYVIPSGATVTVVDDLLFDGDSSTGRITVASDGVLIADALQRSGGPGALTLAINRRLDCQVGSSCVLRGFYRQAGSPHPTPQPDLTAAGTLRAGQVVPCPGWDADAGAWAPDCAGTLTGAADRTGSPNEVGLVYDHADYPPDDDPFHTLAALDAMSPGDVLCWTDPEPTTPQTATDDGFCYELVLVQGSWGTPTAGVGIVVMDVRQTSPSDPVDSGYPLYLRQVTETRTLRDVAAGSPGGRPSYLEVPNDALPGTATVRGPPAGEGTVPRVERVGMFLRFEDGTGGPRNESHRISRTWNDPADGQAPLDCSAGPGSCDVLEIVDPRGFPEPQDARDTLWIDYGHARNEAFFVYRPLHVREAAEERVPGASTLHLSGTVSLRALLIEDTALRLNEVEGELTDVWIRDPYSGAAGGGAILQLYGIQDFTFLRFHASGGAPPGLDAIHGVSLNSSSKGRDPALIGRDNEDLLFQNVAMRHMGDDVFSSPGDATDVTIRRVRAQFASGDGDSMEFLSNNAQNEFEVLIEDAECVQCNSNDAFVNSGALVNTDDAEVRRFLRWGVAGTFSGAPGGVQVEELYSVGGDHLLPFEVDRFVVAAADDPVGWASGATGLIDADHRSVRNGIVRDYRRQGNLHSYMHDGEIENVLFLDNERSDDCSTASCPGINLLTPNEGTSLDRITWANRPDSVVELDAAFRANPATAGLYSAQGLLAVGMDRATGEGLGFDVSSVVKANRLFAETTTGPCLDGNVADIRPGAEAGLPPSTVQGPLELHDPSAGRFDPIPGGVADRAACGIRRGVDAPGLDRYRWMHAISHTIPEIQADDPDHDGVPSDPLAAVCTGADDTRCADNCPETFNPGQHDWNEDGTGDACAPQCSNGLDDDGDGQVDFPSDPDCLDEQDPIELPEPGALLQWCAALAAMAGLSRSRRSRPTGSCSGGRSS